MNHIIIYSAEITNHGVQVFDLSRLRTLSRGNNKGEVPKIEPDYVAREIGSSHNLVAFPEAGKIIAVGMNPYGANGDVTCPAGSLAIWDVAGSNAIQPVFEDCFFNPALGMFAQGYVHDAHCVVYHGPDEKWKGRNVCALFAENSIEIIDFDNRSTISRFSYPTAAYVHQGWFSEDHSILFTDDELDEIAGFFRKIGENIFVDTEPFADFEDGFSETYIFDVSDLSSSTPTMTTFESSNTHPSADHNLYSHNGFVYHANYNSGARVRKDLGNGQLEEVAFFDFETTCEVIDVFSCDPFGGCWTHFPYYESGLTIASNIHVGLFILKPILD